MTTTLGTCSLCGGAVTVPTVWYGLVPPTPRCTLCGAAPAYAHGPVIPMQPVRTAPPPVQGSTGEGVTVFPCSLAEVWP